jgi:hypothetical protein
VSKKVNFQRSELTCGNFGIDPLKSYRKLVFCNVCDCHWLFLALHDMFNKNGEILKHQSFPYFPHHFFCQEVKKKTEINGC